MNEIVNRLGKKDLIGFIFCLSSVKWILNINQYTSENFLVRETLVDDCLNWITDKTNKIFEGGVFLSTIWTSIKEYIMIVVFCKRQFTLNSSFSFALSLLIKNLHLPWIQVFRNSETFQDEVSIEIQFTTIFSLLIVIYFETTLSKSHMNFNRRRLANCVVGSELISIALILRGLLASKFLLIFSTNLEEFEYTPLHCFYLRITVFCSLSISHLLSLINLGLTKKVIFKFYILSRIFQSTKELTDIFSELNRFRKMTLSLNYSMSSPTQEELSTLSDQLCIICRDEISQDTCKKLPCGHIYHITCLQNWMIRQYCCPTCLAVISSKSKDPLRDVEEKRYERNKTKTDLLSFLVGCRTSIKTQSFLANSCDKIISLPSMEPDLTSIVFSKNEISYNDSCDKFKNEKIQYLFVFEKLLKIRNFIVENVVYFSNHNFKNKSTKTYLGPNTFSWKVEKLRKTIINLQKITRLVPDFNY